MHKLEHIDRPIRVCFPFIGNNVGGSHISALMLAKHLDRNRVEPVIVLHEEGPLSDYIRAQGLSYELIAIPHFFEEPFHSWRNAASLLIQTFRLTKFILHRQINIVHTNDARIHYGWPLATKLARARLIWHQRTGTFGRSRVKLRFARLASQVRNAAATLTSCFA